MITIIRRILRHEETRYIALASLCGLLAAWPLLAGYLPATHDGLHHLFRLFELDRCLRSGELFPRIFPEMAFGYGYPVLNYYSPLGYYVAWVFTALGSGYIGGLKAAHTVGLISAALAMYLWARSFLPRQGAFIAAVAYSLFPYHLADIYVRGALAESLAFFWPPLLLYLLEKYRRTASRGAWLGTTCASAGFVFTHNLTAFMFAVPIGLYCLFIYGLPRDKQSLSRYLAIAAAVLAGLGLSAFYWLPAIGEVRYVLAGQVEDISETIAQLQPLNQWLSPYLLHRYMPLQGVAGQHPFGICQILAAFAGLAVAVITWRRQTPALRLTTIWATVISLGCVFLLTPASAFAWRGFPMLHYLQFPWRLQAVLTLTTAILSGSSISLFCKSWRREAISLFTAAAIAITGLAGLRLEPAHLPTADTPLTENSVNLEGLYDYDFQTALWLRQYGGEWLLEYLPIWALSQRDNFFLPDEQPESLPPLPNGAAMQVLKDAPLATIAKVSLPEQARLAFHRFYFPGWQVLVDGKPVPTTPYGKLALVSAEVPAGEHTLTVRLAPTSLGLMGNTIAILSVLLLSALAIIFRLRSFWFAPAFGLIFLAMVAFRAHALPTALYPQPLKAEFGGQVKLVGYALEQNGQKLAVHLYWLPLASLDNNLRSFVHASAANGQTLTQHDGQPGHEFSPTSRWLPGEIVPDCHVLQKPDAIYLLHAGLYTWPDIANLSVTLDGQPSADSRAPLGEPRTP